MAGLRLTLLASLAAAGTALAQAEPGPGAAAPPAAGQAPAASADAEPLPAGAPQTPYELAAWCYGAMDQYLYVYAHILPELKDIDRRFGSSVKNEAQPYASDMAAARQEVKVLAGAVTAAEKASPRVISDKGAIAVRQGRDIWTPAEQHTKRELARAWLSWALPDRCDANARTLTAKSELLGKVLRYNAPSATEEPPAPVITPPATDSGPGEGSAPAAPPPASRPPADAAPPAPGEIVPTAPEPAPK